MKIVLPGGSGQVGGVLARHFTQEGHEVVVLSRTPPANETELPWRVVLWDGKTLGDEWAAEIDGATAVINLAGRSVNCRYTPENRAVILNSRVDSTRVVGQAIARAVLPPSVWLQAATATIYAHRLDAPNDESGIIDAAREPNPAWRFSVHVAQTWEAALNDAETPPQTRKVALRTAIVMNPDPGSAFDTLLRLTRRGLGGPQGSGRQMVSWIHQKDFARALEFLIKRDDLRGPINVCAPHAVSNREFMRELRQAAGVPAGIPAPAPLLELGAIFLKTETELLLKSRWTTPGELLRAGFSFDFPEWHSAARDLCALSGGRGTVRMEAMQP